MLRTVLTIFAVYAGLLVLFVGLRQTQLTTSINNRVADATDRLIDNNPVDHKQTLFSGKLEEHVIKNSPHYTDNWSRTDSTHELVTMSPCNPRIKRCR